MPYEIYNDEFKFYSVDYNMFYNTLISSPYLRSISKYIADNIQILQELDNIQTCDKADHFKYSFNFSGINFHIHFNIINIIESVKSSNLPIKKLSSKNFAPINSKVLYSNEPYSENQAKCKEPILLVPFEFPPSTKYIVIDGNHRLSYQLDMNYKTIKHYIYNPISKSDFCFSYDFYLYEFYRNLNKFLN